MEPNKEKILKAFRAMKSLGIATETVRPVLKRLFELYNEDWKFIEEDSYRNLADAIFEAAEDQQKAQDGAKDEPPRKKLHKEKSEDLGYSKLDGERTYIDFEAGELATRASRTKSAKSSQSLRGDDPTSDPDHFAPHAIKKNKGSTEVLQNSSKRKKDNGSGSAHNHQTMFRTIQDIGSSTRGLVKVSLACHRDVDENNFHHPNVDEVLKFVDDKYQKFYRNAGGQFSLVKFLNELCESYLKIGDISVGDTSKRAIHEVSDITNGTEKVEISLLKETGNENLQNFTYIPDNIVYQSAYVHISLARIPDEDCCSRCKGNCLSSSIPCACTRDIGGEFAYTSEGLLNTRFLESCISMKLETKSDSLLYCHDCPLERVKKNKKPRKCQGHPSRKFIKECWKKCGCNMDCGNRVVQRGITRKLQVFVTSEGKGWGVRTLEKLPAGAFICEYVGEILTNIELYERNQRRSGKDKHVYPVLLDADWGTESILKDEDALCLDATYYGNVARFMNHRCFDGNLLEIPVQVETPDRHYYHLAFFTKREVDALEELTWDYGIDFDDHNHPIKAFKCCCGSQYCRDR